MSSSKSRFQKGTRIYHVKDERTDQNRRLTGIKGPDRWFDRFEDGKAYFYTQQQSVEDKLEVLDEEEFLNQYKLHPWDCSGDKL